jgi:predicted transposase YdaD
MKKEEGRRKKEEGKEEGRRKRGEGKSKNKEGFSYLAYKPYCRQNLIIQNIILIIT